MNRTERFFFAPMKLASRKAADWVDLQWSLLDAQLCKVASQAKGRLLDVGCGDKPYEAIFSPHVSQYVGVEYEDAFRATNASTRTTKPDFLYDGVTLPFEDASFDTVLSVSVLEHTARPNELLTEMARVLKEDGVLILSAPFSFRLHEEPHDYFRYSPHGLRVMFAGVGLEVVDVIPQGTLWSVLGHKLNTFLALRVARIGGAAQMLGKLGHEATGGQSLRVWTLPVVGPLMVGISAGARFFDWAVPDHTEALGYMIVARRKVREFNA